MEEIIQRKGGTFALNKTEPIHRWYSYIEGYSSILIESELHQILAVDHDVSTIYDPFCGTGTTSLVAAQNGMLSYYSESNPFMQKVIEAKVNTVRKIVEEKKIRELKEFCESIKNLKIDYYTEWDGFEKYFDNEQLCQLLSIKAAIQTIGDTDIKSILMLCLSSIVVISSKMIRRGDLRYATEKEYKPIDVIGKFCERLTEMIEDIENAGISVSAPTIKLSDDSRDNDLLDTLDCVITSPPYLNGTNYIRNTKLELKLNNFIVTEKDLPAFHSKGIVAGINNVSKRKGEYECLPTIKPYIDELEQVAYDERIPKMIKGYFVDMSHVIERLSRSIRSGGFFIMDIGDSQFAGVHIPTDKILSEICMANGFSLKSEKILRKRHSKNGMVLSQVLLRYRLEK